MRAIGGNPFILIQMERLHAFPVNPIFLRKIFIYTDHGPSGSKHDINITRRITLQTPYLIGN